MSSSDELLGLPAWRIQELVSAREISAENVVSATLHRIEERDKNLHAFLTINDAAIDDARAVDRQLAAGEPAGPLCGVPVSIKDLYPTKGIRTTFGSKLYESYIPDEESLYAERLRRAGAIIVGKTNTPEFGIFIRTVNRLGPETVNPWKLSCTSGGSSGGAAASVAAQMTPIAIGSDGGGSIRIPAALCGVIGILPSRGLIPRHGGRISTRLFSSAGPLARTSRDALITLQVLAGFDQRDPLSWQDRPSDLAQPLSASVKSLRLKMVELADSAGTMAEVRTSIRVGLERFASLGIRVLNAEHTLNVDQWRDPFYNIMMADRLASGGQELNEDPQAREQLTDYARMHFDKAARVTGAEYSQALDARLSARATLYSLLEDVEALVMPTVGFTAPEIEASGPAIPDVARRNFVSYTFMQNYTGLPAASVPCGLINGLPVGLQIITRPGHEHLMLCLCEAFEELGAFPEPQDTYAA